MNASSATTLLVAVGILFSAAAVNAQPTTKRVQPRLKRVPAGVTEAQIRQRLSATSATRRARVDAQIAQVKADAEKIQALVRGDQEKVAAALKADPQYAAFTADVQRISSAKGTSAQKAQSIRALARQHRLMFSNAMKKSGVSRLSLENKLKAAVPGTTVTSDFLIRRRVTSDPGTVTPTPPAASAPQTIVLEPPFSYEEEESNDGGVATTDATATANGSTGVATALIKLVGIAGSADARATIGEYIVVPAGVKRMDVTIKAEMEYTASALAVLAATATGPYIALWVTNTTDDSQYQSSILTEMVLAPVGWYAEADDRLSKEFKFSFDVPASDREYFIEGYAGTGATCFGITGAADSEAKLEIDRITITYHK